MAEAIFAKYSKSSRESSSFDPSELISNNTRVALGLNNNATIDDCIMKIASGSGMDLIDPYNVPFEVSLLWYNGIGIPSQSLRVTYPNAISVNYTTDRNGNIRFSSPPGTVKIIDSCGYSDISTSNKDITCVIGENWNNVIMMRNQRYSNGGYFKIAGNMNLNLSPCINSYDVECKGGDGQGGGVSLNHLTVYAFRMSQTSGLQTLINFNTSWWQVDITIRGNSIHSVENNIRVSHTIFHGGRGESGKINTLKNCRTTGNIRITVGSGAKEQIRWINGIITSKSDDQADFQSHNIYGLVGNTGETTSFGSLLYATGGNGGGIYNPNNSNWYASPSYDATEGGKNITVMAGITSFNNNIYNGHYNVGLRQNAFVNSGYVNIYNIQYK